LAAEKSGEGNFPFSPKSVTLFVFSVQGNPFLNANLAQKKIDGISYREAQF